MTLRALALPLALAAAAASASTATAQTVTPWRTDVPCAAPRDVARPDSANLPGCARSWCAELPDGRRVCSCQGDTAASLRLEAQGRTVREWSADWTYMEPSYFMAMATDLDGDGRAEVVVDQLEAISNGLGVEAHRITIVDGANPGAAPVQVSVNDARLTGSFVRPAAGGACRLVATTWGPLMDTRRGEGVYLVGTWMTYAGGAVRHDPDRPVVVRRLLDSFTREDDPAAPFAYLRDRRAEAWTRGLPLMLPPLAGRGAGTIRVTGKGGYEVRLADGGLLRYAGQGGELALVVDEGQAGGGAVAYFVDRATNRLYPEGYAAADEGWRDGKAVTVARYEDRGSAVHLVIVD